MALYEECGVLYSSSNKYDCASLLKLLQHRGQDAYGIITDKNEYKDFGEIPKELKIIDSALCHVRYCTSGDNSKENIQPIVKGELSLSFNGQISTYNGPYSDAHYIADYFVDTKASEMIQKINEFRKNNIGGYSIILKIKNDIWFFKDMNGRKPLCYSYDNKDIVIASESRVMNKVLLDSTELDNSSIGHYHDGKLNLISCDAYENKMCVLELIYFMKADSIFRGDTVESFRKKLGNEILPNIKLIPIPNTANNFISKTQINNEVKVIKESLHRSFISKNMKTKYYIEGEPGNDHLNFVDDSIIAGDTILNIHTTINKVNSTYYSCFPEVINKCNYGVNIDSNIKEIRDKKIKNIDIKYPDINLFNKAIGEGFCDECYKRNKI